jgi:hypothetical protein
MRGFIVGLILGAVLVGAGYEKGVLSVGSPGKVDWQLLQSIMPVKIQLARNQE